MNKDQAGQTDERLSPLLEHFCERVTRLFNWHYFILMFEDDEDMRGNPSSNPRTWAL